MAANSPSLLDGLQGLITPDVLGKAASALGESDAAVRKGVSATVPAVLGSVAHHVDDPGFAAKLFEMVKSPANDGTALNNVGNLLSANSSAPIMSLGNKLLGTLFGGSTSSLSNSVAGFAGMKSSSAMSLLNFAAPLVLAFLGKRARKENLNAASLANLLRNERDAIEAAVPGPLAHLEPERERVVERERQPSMPPPSMERMTYATATPTKSSPLRWLLPLAAAIIAIALLVNLMGRDRATPAQSTQTVTAPTAAPAGTVFFESDQATLPANGQAALAPVVTYLQQNPNATAVVSGYHDPTGDPAMNEQLAQSRAEAVRSSLISAGIADSRIEMREPGTTQGGGTPEQARRVEVTVR